MISLTVIGFVRIHTPTVLALMKEDGSRCLDTVGAVVVDLEGNVAAAVSSGGLAMKHPGRVGQVGLSLYNNAHLCVTASFCQLWENI